MLAFIILVGFSINDAFTKGYSLYRYLGNENVDVEVTFDGNSSNHIVMSDKIVKLTEYVEYYGSFFNMDSTIQVGDTYDYVNILSGTTEELNSFINTKFEHLQYDEININEKFAEKHVLVGGVSLSVLIGK